MIDSNEMRVCAESLFSNGESGLSLVTIIIIISLLLLLSFNIFAILSPLSFLNMKMKTNRSISFFSLLLPQAQLSGKESPSADDVKSILAAASAEVDDAKLSSFMSEVEGKDIAALIEEGNAKLASVPSGGGGVGGGVGGDAGGGEAKKEEVVEEEEEDMGFDLFD